MTPAENFVDFKNVWLAYNEALLAQNQFAVEDINLQVKQGEFIAIVGPSGCGKTTILRTISGFTDPTQGVIRIGGQDMSGIGPNQRPTALIFQNLALFPLMTVSENIGYGLRVRGVSKADRMKKAGELPDELRGEAFRGMMRGGMMAAQQSNMNSFFAAKPEDRVEEPRAALSRADHRPVRRDQPRAAVAAPRIDAQKIAHGPAASLCSSPQ